MSTVSINLATKRGGIYSFGQTQEALSWVRSQINLWSALNIFQTNDEAKWLFDQVAERWNQIFGEISYRSSVDSEASIEILDEPKLIAHESAVFQALIWVAENLSEESFRAAEVPAQIWLDGIDWDNVRHVAGVLSYEQKLREALEKPINLNFEDVKTQISGLESNVYGFSERVEMLRMEIGTVEGKAGDVVNTYADKLKEIESLVEGAADMALTATVESSNITEKARLHLEHAFKQINEEKDNVLNGLREQAKLQKPIKLWAERASNHETATELRRNWMVGVGIGGLPLGCLVAWVSLLASKRIFASFFPPSAPNMQAKMVMLREAFQYEALFASAVTLAYFTMYLWAMRLLVRLYSTEHHLGIDAKGRAALAETYLSFTSDGDATKSDRAIMLAVLFRPVIDGMVKDEGPPALSPAAVISGIASASRR